MRVLLAHTFYRTSAPSGEDAVYRNEAALLERNGVEVIRYEKHNDELDESTFSRRLGIAARTTWSHASYSELQRLLRRTRPDIAHFHNTFPQISPSGYRACRDAGVPIVQTAHNYRFVCPGALLLREERPCELCIGGSLLPALKHRCYRGSLAATAAVVAMLEFNRRAGSYTLVDRYIALTRFAAGRLAAGGLPVKRIAVKPNFVDVRPPRPARRHRQVIYTGRLSAEKGLHVLLDAWATLDGIPLLIAGDGPLRAELETITHARGLDVHFLGHLPRTDLLKHVSESLLQVVPSQWYEGFPVGVLEAYACGTPVIASRIGSLDEIVIEGETGLKFAPSDAHDLANAVVKALDNPERLETFSQNALREVNERYGPEANFVKLMEIYREATIEHQSSSVCNGIG